MCEPHSQPRAEALQAAMIGLMEESRSGLIASAAAVSITPSAEMEVKISGGTGSPSLPLEITIKRVSKGKCGLEVDIPDAAKRGFWLSLLFSSLAVMWTDDKSPIRRCAGCSKFYLPYNRAPGQRFDSNSCARRALELT